MQKTSLVFLVVLTVAGCAGQPSDVPSQSAPALWQKDMLRLDSLFREPRLDHPRNFTWWSRTDPAATFAHYFTWRVYGEAHGRSPYYRAELDPKKAIYVFDDEVIGEGWRGFEALKVRLGGLSAGSRVVMYPDYRLASQSSPLGTNPERVFAFPFQSRYDDLIATVLNRDLVLIGCSDGQWKLRVRGIPTNSGDTILNSPWMHPDRWGREVTCHCFRVVGRAIGPLRPVGRLRRAKSGVDNET